MKPSELIFISRILKDGTGVEIVTPEHLEYLLTNPYVGEFTLKPLSMSHKTYIASNMSTYVVKLKSEL